MIVRRLSDSEIKESIIAYARKKYGMRGSLEGKLEVKVTDIMNKKFHIIADVWEKR